jgi:5'-3' exonuclease
MILVDMNQVTISNLMMQVVNQKDNEVNEDMVRHMVLNALRSYRSKFYEEYGELVICYDGRNYWRREIFPFYKQNRKKTRESSNLNWVDIFKTLNKIKDEIKEIFPYKVLEIDNAEADDIIASIVFHTTKNPLPENVLIISSDKDFFQLQTHSFVKQYSPTLKKFVSGADPAEYIKVHILKGDRGDGIPNFLSSDNTFVDNLRQKPLGANKIDKLIHEHPKDFCNEEMLRNYQRNQRLIDLSFVPSELQDRIIQQFKEVKCGNRSRLLNYFIKNRLKNLTESLSDF